MIEQVLDVRVEGAVILGEALVLKVVLTVHALGFVIAAVDVQEIRIAGSVEEAMIRFHQIE